MAATSAAVLAAASALGVYGASVERAKAAASVPEGCEDIDASLQKAKTEATATGVAGILKDQTIAKLRRELAVLEQQQALSRNRAVETSLPEQVFRAAPQNVLVRAADAVIGELGSDLEPRAADVIKRTASNGTRRGTILQLFTLVKQIETPNAVSAAKQAADIILKERAAAEEQAILLAKKEAKEEQARLRKKTTAVTPRSNAASPPPVPPRVRVSYVATPQASRAVSARRARGGKQRGGGRPVVTEMDYDTFANLWLTQIDAIAPKVKEEGAAEAKKAESEKEIETARMLINATQKSLLQPVLLARAALDGPAIPGAEKERAVLEDLKTRAQAVSTRNIGTMTDAEVVAANEAERTLKDDLVAALQAYKSKDQGASLSARLGGIFGRQAQVPAATPVAEAAAAAVVPAATPVAEAPAAATLVPDTKDDPFVRPPSRNDAKINKVITDLTETFPAEREAIRSEKVAEVADLRKVIYERSTNPAEKDRIAKAGETLDTAEKAIASLPTLAAEPFVEKLSSLESTLQPLRGGADDDANRETAQAAIDEARAAVAKAREDLDQAKIAINEMLSKARTELGLLSNTVDPKVLTSMRTFRNPVIAAMTAKYATAPAAAAAEAAEAPAAETEAIEAPAATEAIESPAAPAVPAAAAEAVPAALVVTEAPAVPEDGIVVGEAPMITTGPDLEKQEGLGCGRHALNNLFGKPLFVKAEAPAGVEFPFKIPGTETYSLKSICQHVEETVRLIQGETEACSSSENYDINTLLNALRAIGYRGNTFKLSESTPEGGVGFLVNTGPVGGTSNHWIAIRNSNRNRYEIIDSLNINQRDRISSLADLKTKYPAVNVNAVLHVEYTGKVVDILKYQIEEKIKREKAEEAEKAAAIAAVEEAKAKEAAGVQSYIKTDEATIVSEYEGRMPKAQASISKGIKTLESSPVPAGTTTQDTRLDDRRKIAAAFDALRDLGQATELLEIAKQTGVDTGDAQELYDNALATAARYADVAPRLDGLIKSGRIPAGSTFEPRTTGTSGDPVIPRTDQAEAGTPQSATPPTPPPAGVPRRPGTRVGDNLSGTLYRNPLLTQMSEAQRVDKSFGETKRTVTKKGGVRKRTLRTRRGVNKRNVRGTRRRKNRADRTHKNSR